MYSDVWQGTWLGNVKVALKSLRQVKISLRAQEAGFKAIVSNGSCLTDLDHRDLSMKSPFGTPSNTLMYFHFWESSVT